MISKTTAAISKSDYQNMDEAALKAFHRLLSAGYQNPYVQVTFKTTPSSLDGSLNVIMFIEVVEVPPLN